MSTNGEKEPSREAEQYNSNVTEERAEGTAHGAEDLKPDSQNGERAETEDPHPVDDKLPQCKGSTAERPREDLEPQKTPEELAPRRNFQIPRKNREKKALFQPVISGSREFEDILKILHSSYLEPNSVANFNYKKASLVHSELLEKEFTEKRRELKFDGRMEKELVEAYAFLLVDRPQVQNICEKGLHVGHSKVTILGNPSMGVYLSRFADLLQANPLEPGASGDVVIFKIIKGKIKSIFDQPGKNLDSASKRGLDPTPKHECHVSKNANRVNSLLAYRAYELTQYYLYEYGFDEIRRRPRHVCPYAVVSFGYKDEMSQVPKAVTSSRSSSLNAERNMEHLNYTLWRGQLLNKGKHLCHAYMKSATRPFLPFKLNEKLDVETVMTIDQLKKKVPAVLFYKETYIGLKEVLKGGMYCSLYEVVEKSRTGSNLESILQKLEKDKIAFVKPLGDKGFLFLLSPLQMASPYEPQIGKVRVLLALFLFQEPRGVVNFAHKCSVIHENREIMPEIMTFIRPLHYGLIQSRKDTTADFNTVVERHAREYLKRRAISGAKFREFVLYPYESRLDEKRFLYSTPKNRQNMNSSMQNYLYGPNAYIMEVAKAKELLQENHKPQQFSPVSDYEAVEEEAENPKTDQNNGTSYENPVLSDGGIPVQQKPLQNVDFDQDKLKDLITLIHIRKQGDEDPETENNTNTAVLKRKLESGAENVCKMLRSESAEAEGVFEGERMTDSRSVGPLISGLGGQDSELRQQDESAPTVPDSHGLLKLLLETLAGAGHLDASLAQSVNQALGLQADGTNEDVRRGQDYGPTHAQDIVEHEQSVPVDYVSFKEPLSPVHVATDAQCMAYPIDIDFRVRSTENMTESNIRMHDDQRDESISSFDGYSPCPSTPIEHVYRRQYSGSSNLDGEMHWRLIPITGMKSSEDLAYLPPADVLPNDPRIVTRLRNADYDLPYSTVLDLQRTKRNDFFTVKEEDEGLIAEEHHMFSYKHLHSGIIETTVLDEYSHFSRRIQQLLKEHNIDYISKTYTPILSTHARVAKLSQRLHSQTSEICVQHYVDALRVKLNNIVTSFSTCHLQTRVNNSLAVLEDDSVIESMLIIPVPEARKGVSSSVKDELESKYADCSEQYFSRLPEYYRTDKVLDARDTVLPLAQTAPTDGQQQPPQTAGNLSSNITISATQPALSDFINQLKPEVFNSLVKIIKDVQKNTVKFYIHTEEENTVCREIKEYLAKLGNTECNPEQFLETKGTLDKLLIIIQNEDIESSIHKISGLVNLKRHSSVSFAGVDSLDDVKNHTYNELFVSGGFVVSDESVLDPESVTVDKLKDFLNFLEELSSPDGKWQWKIHCKIQKKLKELGRINAKALSVLTLLNTYQKKHLVEILAYHSCDSQTRNAPELDCLVRLQAQNIQQRHIVFLTEKNVKMFSNYTNNGIIISTIKEFMEDFEIIVGHHNSSDQESCLSQIGAEKAKQPESNEKDEEDMSLDSGDETSQIEVCSKPPTHEALSTGCSQAHGLDVKLASQSETQLTNSGLTEVVGSNHSEEFIPVISVSTTICNNAEQSTTPEQLPGCNMQDCQSRPVNVAHPSSQFNVLTHQTFLGTPYPISAGQPQEDGTCLMSTYSQDRNG
ncbi:protein TASOR isoform X2 [Ambystoma mexicanum]|uniref:protein TASOR isoform X2 n=1 Tax=Ambystoma mexicanum TaxID=8296 RepID=UPI0037E785D4